MVIITEGDTITLEGTILEGTTIGDRILTTFIILGGEPMTFIFSSLIQRSWWQQLWRVWRDRPSGSPGNGRYHLLFILMETL